MIKGLINTVSLYLSSINKIINFIKDCSNGLKKINETMNLISSTETNLDSLSSKMSEFINLKMKYLSKNKLNVDLVNKIFARNNYDCFQNELLCLQFDCEPEEKVLQKLSFTINKKYLLMRPPKHLVKHSLDNGILTLSTKLYEIQYILDYLNENEFKWAIYSFKILKMKFNFKILSESDICKGLQILLNNLYLPEILNHKHYSEIFLFEFIDYQIKSFFSKCLIQYIDKEWNSHEKKSSFPEISRIQKINDFCLIFYYQSSHSLTSNLSKKDFFVKFNSPLKSCIDYVDFIDNSDYPSITYYDNISISFSEEILDLASLNTYFSELNSRFPDNVCLYELDLFKIKDKIIPLTSELIMERLRKKRNKIELDLIFSRVNMSLQLHDFTNLIQQLNKPVKRRFSIKYIYQEDVLEINKMEVEANESHIHDIGAFYLFQYKRNKKGLFMEFDMYQDLNITVMQYEESLNFYSFLVENEKEASVKEQNKFNKYQNEKLMEIMWKNKDLDFFFITLTIFNFHFFLKNNLLPNYYKHFEDLQEERPFYILQTQRNSYSANGAQIIIKTFGDMRSYKDFDILIKYEKDNNKFEFVSFKDFISNFFSKNFEMNTLKTLISQYLYKFFSFLELFQANDEKDIESTFNIKLKFVK